MTIQLNIPIITSGTQKTVDFGIQLDSLGDNYQQLSGSNMGQSSYKIEWMLRSAPTEYAEIDAWTEIIDSIGGSTEVLINLNDTIGTLGLYITGYNLEYTDANKGTLTLNCRQLSGGEMWWLAGLLPTTGIVSKVNTAANHIWNNRTNDFGTYMMIHEQSGLVPTTCLPEFEEDLYQCPHGGTSKDALALIKALLLAHKLDNTQGNLSRAVSLFNVMRNTVFPSTSPVNNLDANWLPHWRIHVKFPQVCEKVITSNFINSGYHVASENTFTFTRIGTTTEWVGSVPDLSRVFSANPSSQSLAARYVFAPKLNPILDNIEVMAWTNVGGESFIVDKTNVYGAILNNAIYTNNGLALNEVKIRNNTTNEVSPFRIIHSKVNIALTVNNGQRHEVFPLYRLPASNEFNFEFQVANDLVDSVEIFKEVDASSAAIYQSYYDAIKESVLASAILTENTTEQDFYIFKIGLAPDGSDTAYADGLGLGFRNYDGVPPRLFRSTSTLNTGWLIFGTETYTQNLAVFQEFRIRNSTTNIVWSEDTRLQCTFYVNFHTRGAGYSDIIYIYIDTAVVAGNSNTTSFFAPICLEHGVYLNNLSLNYLDFCAFFDKKNSKNVWYAASRRDYYSTFGSPERIITATRKNVAMTFNNPNGMTTYPCVMEATINKNGGTGAAIILTIPLPDFALIYDMPKIFYRVLSGDISFIVRDGNGNDFAVPASIVGNSSNGWQYRKFTVSELTPYVPGQVFNNQLPITMLAISGISSVSTFQIYYVGEPPTKLPIECQSYETAIGTRFNELHDIYVGDIQVLNTQTNYLPYTPGVVPQYGSRVGNQRGWFLEPNVGTQLCYLYKKYNRSIEANNVANFYRDSQLDYYKASGVYQWAGFFTPIFHWSRFSAFAARPFDVWTMACTNYPYMYALKHEYQYYAFLDAAKALHLDKKDAVLKRVVENTLESLVRLWTITNFDWGNVPDTFSNPGSYLARNTKNIFGAALVLQGAIYANLAGCSRINSFFTIWRCFLFLEAQYVSTGDMAGTWSKDMQTSGNFAYYRPRWHGVCMQAYALLYEKKPLLNYPTVAEWGQLA